VLTAELWCYFLLIKKVWGLCEVPPVFTQGEDAIQVGVWGSRETVFSQMEPKTPQNELPQPLLERRYLCVLADGRLEDRKRGGKKSNLQL